MQAFVDGKEIECSCPLDGRGWETEDDPVWEFGDCYYRIKREPRYRPYANAEECFEDVKMHGGWVKMKGVGFMSFISAISCNGVDYVCDNSETFNELLERNVWADDGSPCGVKEY